ncbi:MAG: energy transducer TonB [Opitutaceae bacterium]|nr:energy transducer TonB [Opitutaceae bacterium]
MSILVDEKGNGQNPVVRKSTRPEFEQPAIDAVLKWKFQPAKKEGQSVAVQVVIRLSLRTSLQESVPYSHEKCHFTVGRRMSAGFSAWFCWCSPWWLPPPISPLAVPGRACGPPPRALSWPSKAIDLDLTSEGSCFAR